MAFSSELVVRDTRHSSFSCLELKTFGYQTQYCFVQNWHVMMMMMAPLQMSLHRTVRRHDCHSCLVVSECVEVSEREAREILARQNSSDEDHS